MVFGKKSCLPSDGLGFRQGQNVVHDVCGRKLGLIIQVAVDVCRGADVAVAQPFLDLLHGNVVGQQERGGAVPEIVENGFCEGRSSQKALGTPRSDNAEKSEHLRFCN